MTDLPAAAAAARTRYEALGREWVRRFDIARIHPRKNLSGRAYSGDRHIETPWPSTTLRRLYILAHEIGHVVLHPYTIKFHLPSYVMEFECEMFAHALMRSSGLRVPAIMTKNAKAYVARKVQEGSHGRKQPLDPSILEWTGHRAFWQDMRPDLFTHNPDFFNGAKRRVRKALNDHPQTTVEVL